MKRVMVIDFEDSFVYNIIELLRQEKVDFFVINAKEVTISESDSFTAAILSPGGALPADYPNIREFINHYHSKVPLLGICLGFQAICNYFGGELYQIEKPLHGHSAILNISSPTDLIFKNIEQGCCVGLYHSWAIKLSKETPLVVLATDQRGVIMAIKHHSLPIYGMQFHPESIISGENGKMMVRNWLAMCKI